MSLKLNSSGGGSVTLQEPVTASALTLTLPSTNGTVVATGDTGSVTATMLSTGAPSWTSGGVLSFNSGYGSSAVAYGVRAWVNFNGTGTIAIRGSGNVSSITDGGTGLYTVNLSTAMPDANYSVAMVIKNTANSFGYALEADVSAGSFNLGLRNTSNGALFDSTTVCATVTR